MKYLLVSLLIAFAWQVSAQDEVVAPADEVIMIPYRPRIAEFTISNLYEYTVNSSSNEYGSNAYEIEHDMRLKARLGIPFVIKQGFMAGLQLKYDRQNFVLELEDNNSFELYEHISNTNFTSLGARFFLQKNIADGKVISALVGAELKSDEIVWTNETSKYYANVNYKVEQTEYVKIGGGIALSYTLGAPQIYPIFFYENQFSRKWTLDMALPKVVILRFRPSPKCFLSFKTEVKGWRYAVHNEELFNYETLTLRKSDIRMGFSFEHEIHDWLWVGADAGYSKNLRHYLARPGDRRRDAIIDLQASNAPYLNLSIFIVPPKKLYSKK